MSKHTPGPWHSVQYGPYHNIQSTPYYDEDPINLLDLQECDRAEANAKLCQAAPDLLETLERLLLTSCAAVDPSKDNIYMKKFYEARDKAFEAIKKATL